MECKQDSQQDYHEKLWDSTTGSVVGKIQHGPQSTWEREDDLEDGHSNWLPETMASLLSNTEAFCDFMSLSPPDGLFMKEIKKALAKLAKKSKESNKKIAVRFLFGNIIGVPVNCDTVIEDLTEDLPTDSKLEIWVGA